MTKRLYLMRHGETLFNKEGRIQGWCDSPLTDNGIKQALRARDYFVNNHITINHVFTSTSERCIDTLELITSLEYTRLKSLKEHNYGLLEGESERLNKHLTPKDCETFYLQYGGESSNDVKDRMVDTITNIMDQYDNVLIMSHGGAIFNFIRGCGIDTTIFSKGVGNCAIFVFDYDKEFKLVDLIRNDK